MNAEQQAKDSGIIGSKNEKYDPDDHKFQFNGESLFFLINHISDIEISYCDSGHSFDVSRQLILTIFCFSMASSQLDNTLPSPT